MPVALHFLIFVRSLENDCKSFPETTLRLSPTVSLLWSNNRPLTL
jgi:hypothetical protein